MAMEEVQDTLKSISSENTTDGAIVFFSSQANRRLLLSKFDSKEEAQLVYDKLNEHRHPNIAKVNAVFKGHYLAYELPGKRLDEMIAMPKFIIPFFFHVTQFIIENEIGIQWVAKLENIYVLEEDGDFIFKLVGFREGGRKSVVELCNDFSIRVLREINTQCGWVDANTPPEMKRLLFYLESNSLDVLGNVILLPILWSLSERRTFIKGMGDCLKNSYDTYVNLGIKDVLKDKMTDWDNTLSKSASLLKLKTKCDTYEEGKYLMQCHLGGNIKPPPFQPIKDPINGLLFFRKNLAHFYENRIADLPDVDSVIYELEKAFPDLIMELSEEIACKSDLNFLIPKRDFLTKLFEREI